jgi:hypothetical protein
MHSNNIKQIVLTLFLLLDMNHENSGKNVKNILSEERICLFPDNLANLMREYIYFGKQLVVFGVIHEMDGFKTSSTGSSEKTGACFCAR